MFTLWLEHMMLARLWVWLHFSLLMLAATLLVYFFSRSPFSFYSVLSVFSFVCSLCFYLANTCKTSWNKSDRRLGKLCNAPRKKKTVLVQSRFNMQTSFHWLKNNIITLLYMSVRPLQTDFRTSEYGFLLGFLLLPIWPPLSFFSFFSCFFIISVADKKWQICHFRRSWTSDVVQLWNHLF